METPVRERLVGALVLVALVVLFVPALLKGPARKPPEDLRSEQQVVEFPLPNASEPLPDDALVPEPESAPPEPAAIAEAPPEREDLPEPETAAAAVPPAREPARATAEETGSPSIVAGQPAWAVQLGAFSTREKAEGLVAELRRRGYAAFFLEYRANGRILHRVRVGPEQDRARAVAIADRLRKDGYQPVVAPHP